MKNIYLLSIILLTMVLFSSCKRSEKPNKTTEKIVVVEANATTINWTAYKTTSKVPVKGKFEKLTIENVKKATSAKEALNGLKFSIPVNSIFSNDTIRDTKLRKFFFGIMKNTNLISGTIFIENETSGTVQLTMNGISEKLPITYVINDKTASIEAIMDLNNWKAQIALDALNVACKDLHTGPDGVTKTWSEVKIEVTTSFK